MTDTAVLCLAMVSVPFGLEPTSGFRFGLSLGAIRPRESVSQKLPPSTLQIFNVHLARFLLSLQDPCQNVTGNFIACLGNKIALGALPAQLWVIMLRVWVIKLRCAVTH